MNDNDYFTDVDLSKEEEKKRKKKQKQHPDGYVNLGVFVLLQFVTFGVYYYYCIYKFTKLTNGNQMFPQRRPWVQLLLNFIPFYNWYWIYMTAMRLDTQLRFRGVTSNLSLTTLLLNIFQLKTVSMILLQYGINRSVGGATGNSPDSTGYGTCKHCGNTFPDDRDSCPVCGTPYKKPFWRRLWFQITIAVILVIALWGGVIALSETQDTYYIDQGYYEQYDNGSYGQYTAPGDADGSSDDSSAADDRGYYVPYSEDTPSYQTI